eukprot:30827-Pelagococcus_subviridis.AAC.10
MNNPARMNAKMMTKTTMSSGDETRLSPSVYSSVSRYMNAKKPDVSATPSLPRKRSTSPTMFTAPTVRMLDMMSEMASHAEKQKDLPSIAIKMYAFLLIHSRTFWRYHRQYCRQHAAYLMQQLSFPAFFILCTTYATMMRMNCRMATSSDPKHALPLWNHVIFLND